jgi:hypothetical protein
MSSTLLKGLKLEKLTFGESEGRAWLLRTLHKLMGVKVDHLVLDRNPGKDVLTKDAEWTKYSDTMGYVYNLLVDALELSLFETISALPAFGVYVLKDSGEVLPLVDLTEKDATTITIKLEDQKVEEARLLATIKDVQLLKNDKTGAMTYGGKAVILRKVSHAHTADVWTAIRQNFLVDTSAHKRNMWREFVGLTMEGFPNFMAYVGRMKTLQANLKIMDITYCPTDNQMLTTILAAVPKEVRSEVSDIERADGIS